MKKIILTALSLIIISLPANAKKSRVYAGLDLLHVQADHEYVVNFQATSTQPRDKTSSSSNLGVGLNLGYKAQLRDFYIAPEIFFDYLNSKTPDFYADEFNGGEVGSFKNDELAIDYRGGFKMNFGYNIYRNFDVFVSAGMAATRYVIRFKHPTSENSRLSNGGFDKTPIFGAGMSYNINNHIAIRAAYDYQKLQATYIFKGLVDEMQLHVFRLGAQYSF